MKKNMDNRKKIVKELKALKEKGFTIKMSGEGVLANPAGLVSLIFDGLEKDSLQRMRSNMNIVIEEDNTESEIFEKIGDAKKVLSEYEELIEHKKNSPDLIEYIKYNLED